MNRIAPLSLPGLGAAFLAAACLAAPAASAKAVSDIATSETRRETVELALGLARTPPLPRLPAKLAQPFAPPGFDQPDADEKAAAQAATKGASGAPPSVSSRETLAAIAAKISPSGTISVGESPMLLFGKKFVKVGAHLTVTYKGSDYDLELVAIDRTTFTLRLNHDEITRPIQPGKSP